MAHSRATYGKKLSNGSNGGYMATSKTVYDDVFGGPPKFAMPTRVEDYSDIFGSYHSTRGSSIPILDLPVVEDEADGGLVDVRSSKFDYKEVFGGFDCVDFAVSYEELFASAEARGGGGAVESSSSEDAWTSTGSPSEGSSGEPTYLDNKKACSNGELPDAYHDVKLFNMSYQKTNQISKEDGISGTTHIAHLNAVPAYTFVVDEDIPLQSEKFGKSPAQEVNDNQSMNSNGGVVEGKDFQKTMSEEPACGVPLGNSSEIMEEKNFNKILSDGPACDTFTKTASSDVKSQSNLHENGTFPRKAFITVTEINLRTQPTHVPPPARPPPKLTIKQGVSETSNLKASTGNAHEGARGDDSPPFFDVEIDASSSAAASAAAMKVAMEKAQARLKSAKESMERKRDGLQNRKKLGLKEEIKRKERKEGEIVEEIKGSKLHNNFEIEQIGLHGFDRDQRQREKTRDLNDSQESKGSMYVKGYRSTQHSGEQKRPGDWRAEEQFYELLKREKFETFAEVPEQKRSERKSMPTTEVFGCEQNEKTTTKVAFEQQEGNDVKLKTAASKVQSEEDGKKHKEECELQESDNKVTEAFEREEHEKKLKEAREQQEHEKRVVEAREQQEQERKHKESREQQELERKLRESREQQEQERKHKESREQQELERKLRESREQQEQEKRVEEASEQQEQERKHKESREQHELERKLREAREQQEQDRKLKEAREMVEYAKKLKQAQERKEHEMKLKESQEQKENELKPKEAHQREENQKRQKEAREREENEKRLKESRELEEYAKKLKEVQELEECKIKQKQVREENERRLKDQEENENKLKQALEQAKVACEREENEKKLRELQEQKDLAEACKKEETEKREKEAFEKEETEKREKEAFEKEENKKKQHEQVCEREDHDAFKASQEFSGCNQGEENLIALKISRDITGSENKMKADDDTFIQDIDTNSKATHAASKQGENYEKLNAVQDSSDHKENENMMKAANYASQGKENKELKVTSDQDGRERLTCMVQNFPEHKGFENKEEVNQEKLKEPEEVMVQEKTDKCKKPEQVAFDLEDDKCKHKTVQGAKQQVANGKKMEAASLVSDLEEKRSNLKMSNEFDTKQNTERKEKIFNEKFIREEKEKEKEERLPREREQEKVCLKKIEEEKERAREREKDRMAVERATREARERAYAEARERAERAAVERATAEVRQRALAEARERLERASAEARVKSLAERASVEARLRAERAAVDRATAEARERAEKVMAERAAFEARERVERSVSEKFSGTSRDIGMRHSASFSDLRHPTCQSSSSFSGPLKFPNSSNHSAFANEKSQGAEVESAQRCKAKLERHQRTVERAAKALAEKNKRDVQAQREQAERNRLAETLDADVKRWSSGKEGNLRALLSTLQYILGPESGWQPVPLTDVITAVAVKKAYRKATLCVHPDKLQQRGANIQQKYICEKVFDLLKEAWNKFNSEER